MQRRDFLRATGAAAVSANGLGAAPGPRPNLLFIVIDQLSGLALPHHDSNARMPNCESLAKAGVRFTHAYTAGMTCGPSRASLDTGRYSQTLPGGRQLPPGLPTLPRTLAAEGYVSSHPNGYSLEGERAEHEKWLIAMGYEQPLSSLNGSESMAQYLDLPLKWKCGRAGVAPEHAFDAYCAQRAIRFLETNRNRPFACFLQLRGPHDPYMTPRPWDTLIDPASLKVPPFRKDEFESKPTRQRTSFESQGASKMTDAQIRQILALYYGMAAFSDHCVGLVLARLRELKLDNNTVVILTADHGDTMGRHRFMGKDFAFYEPAMRIPLIVRAPGRRAGVISADPVSGIDIYPTLCDLMGLPKPAEVHGVSLAGRWEGKAGDPNRSVYSSQGTPGRNRAVMLRTPRYKLTRFDDGGSELYDLQSDPDELVNRVNDASYAKIAGGLQRQMVEWDRRYPPSNS